MTAFYAEAGYELDRERSVGAFATILGDERLGYTWIIQQESHEVGYLVLTLKYAMEFGGVIACLDDIYVQPVWRNKGLSTAALLEVRSFCEATGIRAVTVEVGYKNAAAQATYRRAGFTAASDRQLLTLALAPPAHIL